MTEDNHYDAILHQTSNSSDRVQKSGSISNASPGAASASNLNGLNPRSCVTCRRRKVRCDKKLPCTNCQKASIECVYPAPGRAPRRPRKPQDGELMERLRRLEGVVQSLGMPIADDEASDDGEEESGTKETEQEQLRRKIEELKELQRNPCNKNIKAVDEDTSIKGVESRFGRLVVDEGRSRYINPSFWASLSNEVEDIKGILNEESDEDYPSPESASNMSNLQGFVFSHNSKSVDMLSLHPPAEHIPIYWEVFKDRVDPLVKVLHVPSIEPTILEARHRLDQIHRGLELLMFVVYYTATTSLSNEDVRAKFGEEKLDLVMKYKFGCEQALARADFLQTDEMVVVQAFVIYLVCLRRNDDSRVIWTLTGLVVRMAQTLGIHRDGGHYDLSPFEIEMRRRLWWCILILDSRSSEDFGCDPTIMEQSFDTQMPLNVDDVDLLPSMTTFPNPKFGCTEMTFGLIRFEIAGTFRRIQYVPPGPKTCHSFFASVSLEQKEQWITECHTRIEERYLKHCDMSVPLYWVIATVARLIMSKMWLMIYHPVQRQDGGNSLPQETKDKLFITSLENMEYSLLLESEERTKKWGWLFQTYVQWHAIAFLLNELCVRTKGEYVERAWRAVEIVTSRRWGAEHASNRLKSHLWRPLRRLMNKARAVRAKELEKENLEGGATTSGTTNLDLSVVPPWGMSTLLPPSPSGSPLANPNYVSMPKGSGPLAGDAARLNRDGTPQSTTNSTSSNALSGAAQASTASLAPGMLTTSNQFTTSTMSGAPNQDMAFDWSFLNEPNQQISPTAAGPDELMAEAVDWAMWDDMVAQLGADATSASVEGASSQSMPSTGQMGGFGAGISGQNYWY